MLGYKFKCCDCDKEFTEDEAEYRSENIGEFWGAPAYTNVLICPFCGSDEVDNFSDCGETEE